MGGGGSRVPFFIPQRVTAEWNLDSAADNTDTPHTARTGTAHPIHEVDGRGGEGVLEIAFRLRQVKQLVELSQQPYNHLPPPPTEIDQKNK